MKKSILAAAAVVIAVSAASYGIANATTVSAHASVAAHATTSAHVSTAAHEAPVVAEHAASINKTTAVSAVKPSTSVGVVPHVAAAKAASGASAVKGK